MNPRTRIAAALSGLLTLAVSGGLADEVTTHPAVAALLGRLDTVQTVYVACHEDVVTTKADAFRPLRSSVEFRAKADRQTSSGWVLTVTHSGNSAKAVLVEIRNGTGRQCSYSAVGGTWQADDNVVVIPDLDPVRLALGFLYHEILPVSAGGEPASSPARVDGLDSELETVVISDENSRAVVSTKEKGLLSYEGRNPRYTMRENIDEFRRDPALGLVPVKRTVYARMRGVSESDEHMTLENLQINDPGFTLAGDDNTSAGILRQFRTP